ncbi:hypothetical protein [Virgisporangium aurantiacum]|uniref:Uncharacterized protein n=1 Tax=Virgisporangium aurantiacum TaxID=175570 RepID=A0A8J4E551_9ACTN|nr:hypothetical protein [Virgisporangium aurantiacum]GIJ62665.1 hypothetical protein Vau01_101810 [Virgisporangium aurantiacum]
MSCTGRSPADPADRPVRSPTGKPSLASRRTYRRSWPTYGDVALPLRRAFHTVGPHARPALAEFDALIDRRGRIAMFVGDLDFAMRAEEI